MRQWIAEAITVDCVHIETFVGLLLKGIRKNKCMLNLKAPGLDIAVKKLLHSRRIRRKSVTELLKLMSWYKIFHEKMKSVCAHDLAFLRGAVSTTCYPTSLIAQDIKCFKFGVTS